MAPVEVSNLRPGFSDSTLRALVLWGAYRAASYDPICIVPDLQHSEQISRQPSDCPFACGYFAVRLPCPASGEAGLFLRCVTFKAVLMRRPLFLFWIPQITKMKRDAAVHPSSRLAPAPRLPWEGNNAGSITSIGGKGQIRAQRLLLSGIRNK